MFGEKEWSDGEQAVYVFSAFSQRLCAPVTPALLASVATRVRTYVRTDQPMLPLWFLLWLRSSCKFFFFLFFFYKAGGVISGCVKMSEHDCWS